MANELVELTLALSSSNFTCTRADGSELLSTDFRAPTDTFAYSNGGRSDVWDSGDVYEALVDG